MNIVIVGGGKVGLNLTLLLEKNHNVTVIEKREEHCQELAEKTQAMVIQGDGTEIRYLEDANCANANVLVAVTGVDEDNLVACQLAKAAFSVPKVVARVNNPRNTAVFKALKIDIVFDSTLLLAKLIHEGMGVQELISLAPIGRGNLRIVEATVSNSAVIGKKLTELGLIEKGILVVSIVRGEDVFIPFGASILQKDDHLIVVISPNAEESLSRVLAP